MFCKNCGANLPEGSAFCTNCGKDVREQSQIPPSQPPGAYQAPPVQPPGMYQQGYTMPPAQYPVRQRNTGRIVLWCVLAAVALTAIIVVCALLFSAPKDKTAGASATPGAAETLKPTPAPSPTEAPTTMLSGTISGFPYDFVQLSYPEADFTLKDFSDIEDFETELTAAAWNYYEARNVSGAVSFNGGYVDIAYPDSTQTIYQYILGGDYTLKNYQLSAQDASVINEYDNSYWTQGFEGSYAACYDLNINTELNGTTYKTVIVMFISETGDLVETMALYDPYGNTFAPISNCNVYQKSGTPASNPSNTNNGQALTQEEFQSTLQGSAWVYFTTEDAARDMTIDDYSDIEPVTPCSLIFASDMQLGFLDSTGEESVDEPADYFFGQNHAYVPFEQYEYSGVTYEIDWYYYISADGTLAEQLMAYDAASEMYYSLSNLNVYYAAPLP